MKIKGLNLKGISLREFKGSQISIPITVCKHKYGAKATWSHGTDLYKPNLDGHGFDGEANSFKYNLQTTIWENHYYGGSIEKEIKEMDKTGRVGFGVYYLTPHWQDPFTKELCAIPDYGNKVWTQNAYDKGLIAQDMVGKSKAQNYPAIDHLYELTNGKYGFNTVTGEIGNIDVVTGIMNAHHEWFERVFKKKPSTLGYGTGFDKLKIFFKNIYLGCRNSIWKVDDYDYNMSKEILSSFPITTRQNDMSGERVQKHKECQQYLQNAINQNGWYRDFTHWHWCSDTELEDFYKTQREIMDKSDVVSLSFGEAVEYMVLRQNCTDVNAYTKDNKIYIEGTFNNKSDIIKTTLSVRISLVGTHLVNKEIKSTYGTIKLGTNDYIVQIPSWGFTVIEEDLNGIYLDFSKPTILKSELIGRELLKITTDKPTNIVIFKTPSGEGLYKCQLVKRSNTLSSIHYINISSNDFNGSDIYIGAITNEKQSILVKYNF